MNKQEAIDGLLVIDLDPVTIPPAPRRAGRPAARQCTCGYQPDRPKEESQCPHCDKPLPEAVRKP